MYYRFQTSDKQIRRVKFFNTPIFFPQHSIKSAYKHLTFQFVLLELVTRLIYAPLPSTHQPRPMGEYSWQVCCLLDGMLSPLLNLSSLRDIGMYKYIAAT